MENLESTDLGFTNMEPMQGFSSDMECHPNESLSQHSSIIIPGFLNGNRSLGQSLGDASEFGMNDSLDMHDFAITSSGVGLASHFGMGPLAGELPLFGLPAGPSLGFPSSALACQNDLTMPQPMSVPACGRMPVYSFLPRNSLPGLISSESCPPASLAPPSFSFHSFPVAGGFGDGFSMPVSHSSALSFRGLPNIQTMMIGNDQNRPCFASTCRPTACSPMQVLPLPSFAPPPMSSKIPPPLPVTSTNHRKSSNVSMEHKRHGGDLSGNTVKSKSNENAASRNSHTTLDSSGQPNNKMNCQNNYPAFSRNNYPVFAGHHCENSYMKKSTSSANLVNSSKNKRDGSLFKTKSSNDNSVSKNIDRNSGMMFNQTCQAMNLDDRQSNNSSCHIDKSVQPHSNESQKLNHEMRREDFLAVECESIMNSDSEEIHSSQTSLSPSCSKNEVSVSESFLTTLKEEDRLLDAGGLVGYVSELNEGELSQAASRFMEKMDINVHIEDTQCVIMDGHKRWKCLQCPKMYSTKHNLITHILGHRGIKPHYCSICGKFFKQISHLQTHLLTHGKVKPHVCTICNRNFTQTSHVKRHMAVHMERRPHVCQHCNRGFAYPNELKNHMDKHKTNMEHTCEECGTIFDVAEKLRKHKAIEHRDSATLVCKVCGKAYTYPSQLRDHSMKHEGSRPYICGECGMDFMKEHHLKAHVFTHTGLRPYTCRLCEKAFNQKANLQRHMLVHNGEKKYACEVCGRGFTQHQVLRAHLVTHQETKPFQCKVCGKGFSRLHNLNGHMHMHDGEKPFICYCGSSFTLKGNLNRHKKDKQCLPNNDLKDSSSSSKEEEAAKILNEMSGKKSSKQKNGDADGGSPTPKKKRKSVPRKTMSQDTTNDVDEEVAAAWQLMKDSILEDDDDEEEEDDDDQDDNDEIDSKPNYVELMAMLHENEADRRIDNTLDDSKSIFQCLDQVDPTFQFPVTSGAIEVTAFLGPSIKYNSSNSINTMMDQIDLALTTNLDSNSTLKSTSSMMNGNWDSETMAGKQRTIPVVDKEMLTAVDSLHEKSSENEELTTRLEDSCMHDDHLSNKANNSSAITNQQMMETNTCKANNDGENGQNMSFNQSMLVEEK